MTRILLLLALTILPGMALAQAVPEPEGYRMDSYRAPVPATATGATTVNPDEAFTLWQAGKAAFVDVLPNPPRPANLPKGTIWRDKKRDSIPGAVWLPNTGYGAIDQATMAYFRRGLEMATGGDLSHPVLIFCKMDCWMSWNAVKRAIELGYTDVYWLPEGTDGWQSAGHSLERVRPQEPQPHAQGPSG